MSTYCIDYTMEGKILQQRSGVGLEKLENLLFMLLPSALEKTNDVYVDSGVIKELPAKPSLHHIFDYTTKQWIDPRTPETEWPLVRADRDRRLLACDWTQLPDVPLATKEAWATYRQALRDITEQPDPFNITWPVVPG